MLQAIREQGKRVGMLGVLGFCIVSSSGSYAAAPVTTNSTGSLILTNRFGDLNDDGQVDVRDIVLLSHHLNGTRLLSGLVTNRLDLNQEGTANATDRDILARMIAARFTGAEEDFDEDELSNAAELQRGTSPFDPDTDHDGWLDGWEVADETDPLSALSHSQLLILAQPRIQIMHPDWTAPEETNAVIVAKPPLTIANPSP